MGNFVRRSLITLALVLVVVLVSCTATSPLVGKWRATNGDTMEFTWNGRIIMDNRQQIITGSYEIVSDGYIKLELDGMAGAFASMFGADTMRFKVSNDGNTLTLTGNTGTSNLRRVTNQSK